MDFTSNLIEELHNDLSIELSSDVGFDDNALLSKIKNAVREVKELRNYPVGYTEEMILSDLENMYSKIRGRALYDYNQIGAEYESSHSEKNISRTYRSKSTLFPVRPLTHIVS